MCMTGEIDLLGNVTAIGGLESKLHGGKKVFYFPTQQTEEVSLISPASIQVHSPFHTVLQIFSQISEINFHQSTSTPYCCARPLEANARLSDGLICSDFFLSG